MSHFTCLVIGDDPEEALAPYDENIAVEPYKQYWDSDDYSRWEKILQRPDEERRMGVEPETHTHVFPEDQVLGKEYTLEDMRRVYMRRYYNWDPPIADASTKDTLEDLGFEVDEDPGVDDRLHIDDGGIYQWSSYNPKSKWDWWQIGGRWRGFFKVKEGALALVGDSGVFDNEAMYDADQVRKGDVDIEGMRALAEARAANTWDRVNAVISHLPVAESWESFLGRQAMGEITIEEARKLYHEQVRYVALSEWNRELPEDERVMGPFGPDVEEFQVSREEFIEQARNDALCPYAYIYEGEWHAPGKMGWWANSTDTRADRLRFAREFNELLDSLPDDTLLTLCDLHI